MEYYEYIKIKYRWIPEDIRKQYNRDAIVELDGYVYCEVRKGMYGLKQAARLAFVNLIKLLAHTVTILLGTFQDYGITSPDQPYSPSA